MFLGQCGLPRQGRGRGGAAAERCLGPTGLALTLPMPFPTVEAHGALSGPRCPHLYNGDEDT